MLESDPSPAENIIFLLDHYATTDDANQADPDGNTPLHIAAYLGSVAVAETLLTCARADVNARNKDGATPLDQFELRKQGLLPNLKELQLVDDLEKRTWKRTMQKMGELFQKHVAKRGNQSRDETSESA
jgi:ankyrin repeat protein